MGVEQAALAPQVRRNLNVPFAATVSASLSCVKGVLTSPDIPFNAGITAFQARKLASIRARTGAG
jgi:N-methylhydantoinase B